MPRAQAASEIRLVNGSAGDPGLFIDYPGRDDALLFDAGDNGAIDLERLGDLRAVFVTHHHVDHFIGLDRIVRANLDRDKTLHVYGPEGTIRKVYDRIKSYEYQYFPFQKVCLRVHDVLPGRLLVAPLECSRRFPEPAIEEAEWTGPVLYEDADLAVEAAFADHTVACLAFALVEKAGYHPHGERLAAGALRPGPWVGHVLDLLRSGVEPTREVEIQGGRFRVADLADQYFHVSKGSRLAYITDTAWSDASRPGLLKLAERARRLYCDSYYAHAQLKRAEQFHHMTATQAAELARLARVDELVLIHFAPRYRGHYEALVEEARAIFPRTSAVLE